MTTQSSAREALSRSPAYLAARELQAAQAGLALERQTRREAVLSSWYVGSEAQFRAAKLLALPQDFAFPTRLGGRKRSALAVYSPAAPRGALQCSLVKTGDDRYRLAILNETLPASWRALGRVEIYKYCDLPEGLHSGPATVYVGALAALQSAGIAPRESGRQRPGGAEHRSLWQSQALRCGRHRYVVHHEAEARARAQEEERGRSNFRSPEQYQDWLLEVAAASIGMIRRQLRVKTKGRYIYTVSPRTLKELEASFARLRRAVARAELVVEKEDVRAEEQRAAQRRGALAAMRDANFQRFLSQVLAQPPSRKR